MIEERIPLAEVALLRKWAEEAERRAGRTEVKSKRLAPLIDFARRRSIPRWQEARHLKLIADRIQNAITRATEGRGVKLMIFAPPRHGKSHTTSVLAPTWGLGNFPDLQLILCSYVDKLARAKARQARNLFRSVAPREWGLEISTETSATNDWSVAFHQGRMLSAGARGPLTGEGAHVGIIDDPIKNWEEAQSALVRESLYDWYHSTFSTRIESGGSTILMQTRWHEDDLAGRLLREEGEVQDGGEWEVIRLQAICEPVSVRLGDGTERAEADPLGRKPGEALWPERWPAATLEKRKLRLPTMMWSALFQQRPQPAGGTIFKRDHIRYCRRKVARVPDPKVKGRTVEVEGYELDVHEGPGQPVERVFVPRDKCWCLSATDTALQIKKRNDYFVTSILLITPPVKGRKRRLLVHVYRDRLEAPDQVPELKRLLKAWSPVYLAIEASTAGLATIQLAKRSGLPVYEVHADADKVARALPAAAAYQGGDVFHLEGSEWLAAYEEELLTFPTGVHDDQVDTMAYAELLIRDLVDGGDQVYIPGVNIFSKSMRARQAEAEAQKRGGPR